MLSGEKNSAKQSNVNRPEEENELNQPKEDDLDPPNGDDKFNPRKEDDNNTIIPQNKEEYHPAKIEREH